MRVHPQKLVARLTPTAKRHLETAVGKAVELQHAEVAPEHLLLAMASEPGGDTEALLRACERDPRRVGAEVERSLRSFRAGSAARPRVSDALLRWLEDAWVLASLEWGDTALRSGALLVQLMIAGGRYLAEMPATIDGVSADAARALAPDALRITAEHSEGSPARERNATEGAPTAGPGT